MFTDIEGSTPLWMQSPDAMSAALVEHDRLIRASIKRWSGHVFATGGDGFSVAFASAQDAVGAAIDIQTGLNEGSSVRVRIGLHSGVAYLQDGDYRGPEVNRAARVAAAGHGGQILLSHGTVLELDPVDARWTLKHLGRHVLRGFFDPEPLYQLLPEGLEEVNRPLRAAGAVPNNLIRPTSSFIGRDAEVEEVRQLLGRVPVLTIMGPAGCGKTRLSIECACGMLSDYEDGLWFVELAALNADELIAPAIAAQIGLKEAPDTLFDDQLRQHFVHRKALLILDNCEHLLAGCAAMVARLTGRCPGVRILATSREPLGLPSEHVWRISPLTAPPSGCPADQLAGYPASRLFLERAEAAVSGFRCDESDAEPVVRICRRLDGIPLALELAAARVRALTVHQIDQRLDDRFRLLTGGSRGILTRHQTLRAAMDWSHDLLGVDERLLFRRLAVFSGGCSLEAVEDVCSGDDLDSRDAAELLARLVDRSVVVAEPTAGLGQFGARMRYRMLETVREYSRERLAEAGELESLQTRHQRFYVDLAEQGEISFAGSDQAVWLDRLQLEQDNLRAALGWAIPSDARLRLAAALWRFWYQRGPLAEGRAWLEGALRRSPGCAPDIRAKALSGAGNLAAQQGDYAAAQALHEESLTLRRRMGDQLGVSGSLNNLGIVARARGEGRVALDYLSESLSICRQLGDEARIAAALLNLWVVHDEMGQAAPELLRESQTLYERLEDPWRLATVIHNLGRIELKEGRLSAALDHFKRSLFLFKQVSDKSSILLCLNAIAYVAAEAGDLETAIQLLGAESSARRDAGIAIPSTELAGRATRVEALRNEAGEQAFDTLWRAGEEAHLDLAVSAAASWELVRAGGS